MENTENKKEELKQEYKNKYDCHKWKKIMDTTQSNYANMIKRLERRYKVSNYILIYYSIFLIIITLTGKYFPAYFNSNLGEYFGVVLSVIVLAYSLVNNSANYSVRIARIEDALNKLKTIKRDLNEDSLEQKKEEYNKVADTTERRDDVDFFITVKNLCKSYDIGWISKKPKETKDIEAQEYDEQQKVVNDYISEINVLLEECKIVSEYFWYFILFTAPIGIFLFCILSTII